MPNYINRVGEKHTTNQGYLIEITECFKSANCTVLFEDGLIIKKVDYSSIKSGTLKNPMYRSLCGRGYIGIGKYVASRMSKIYHIWKGVITRGHDKKFHEKYPTYKDVTVCDEWHNFQVFAEWFENNYREDYELDKDILIKGNKIYSPKTCCFVPRYINTLFIKCNSKRGNLPIGVCYSTRDKVFVASVRIYGKSIHLGTFTSSEEAFQAYKAAKEVHIKEVAELYKDCISENTYNALIGYIIEKDD